MIEGKPRSNGPATGHIRHKHKQSVQVATYLSFDMFDEVRNLAVEHNRSFAEQVRLLIEWGLESCD